MLDESTAAQNLVRQRLAAGEAVVGITLTVPSVEVAAQAATLGFDFLWIETEHAPISIETVRGMVLATRGLPAVPFGRVPVNELWTAKRLLDAGVLGVIFPFTSTPELAARAVAACRYPPVGGRGSGAGLAASRWSNAEDYYDFADRNVVVVAVLEDAQAVEHADAIAATPGLDVVFIGTSDLSFSLGLRGRQDEPRLQAAIDRIAAAARRHGKILGRPVSTPADVAAFRAQGFQFFQAPTDLGFLRAGATDFLAAFQRRGRPHESGTNRERDAGVHAPP